MPNIAVCVVILIVGGFLTRKLNRIHRMYTNIDAAIADLTQKVSALTTADESAEALLTGLSTQLKDALAKLSQQGVSDGQLASLQALADAMGTQASGLAAAVTASTPVVDAPPEDTTTAPAGDDTISSGEGDDTITSGDGGDTLTAPDGETIDAGAGNDTVDAGAGADTTSA